MSQEEFFNFQKELQQLANAQDNKVETQTSNFDNFKYAEQKVQKEADDILQIASENSENPEQFILEGIQEYAKAEKISLLAAEAKVLQYLSPEWKEKVDAEVIEYFKKFDLDAFTKLKAGTKKSDEAIKTLEILRNEGYMPYFVIAVHCQDDFAKKEDTLQKYKRVSEGIKDMLKIYEKAESFNTKEAFVLDPQNTSSEAKNYIKGLKRNEYEYAINLAYKYLIIGKNIEKRFKDFDCDEKTLFIQKIALDENLEIGNYMMILNHAALKLDGFPLVIDNVPDIKILSIKECAKQERWIGIYHGSYFWRDDKESYLAQYEDGDNYPKKITGYKKVKNNPYLVTRNKDFSALITGRIDLLEYEGKREEARRYFEMALQMDPNSAETHDAFAIFLESEGKKEEARYHYERALQIDPNDTYTHNNFANLLKSEGEKEEAKRHYEKALQINPNYAEAHYHLATLLYTIGDFKNSRIHLKKFDKVRNARQGDFFILLDKKLKEKGY